MKRRGPSSLLVLLLVLNMPIAAQEPEAEPEGFPDLFLTEKGPVPFTPGRGQGTFDRIDGDWIVCRSRSGDGDGPAGPGFQIQWEGTSYDNIGRFNNDAVQMALRLTSDPSAGKRAEAMLRAGYAQDPHFFAFNYNLARLLRLQRSFDEALRLTERSAAMMPADYHLDLILASLYERKREDTTALMHYRSAARKNPFSAIALIELAEFYRRTDRESVAEDLLRRGMDRFETDPALRLGLGELRMRQKLYNQARILFESIDLPRGDRSTFALRLHHRMARLYDLLGDYRRSRDSYDRLLADTTQPYFLDLNISSLKRERDRVARLAPYE